MQRGEHTVRFSEGSTSNPWERFGHGSVQLQTLVNCVRWCSLSERVHCGRRRKDSIVQTQIGSYQNEKMAWGKHMFYLLKDCHWGEWYQFNCVEYLERDKPVLGNLFDQTERGLELSLKVSWVVTSRSPGEHRFCKGRGLRFHLHLSKFLDSLPESIVSSSFSRKTFLFAEGKYGTTAKEQHLKGQRICLSTLNISVMVSFVPFRRTDVRWQGLDSKLFAESAVSYLSVAWTPAGDDGVVLK